MQLLCILIQGNLIALQFFSFGAWNVSGIGSHGKLAAPAEPLKQKSIRNTLLNCVVAHTKTKVSVPVHCSGAGTQLCMKIGAVEVEGADGRGWNNLSRLNRGRTGCRTHCEAADVSTRNWIVGCRKLQRFETFLCGSVISSPLLWARHTALRALLYSQCLSKDLAPSEHFMSICLCSKHCHMAAPIVLNTRIH